MGYVEDKWLDKNCWKNKSRLYRYFALLNMCILGFGAFVAYDSLGSQQEVIMEKMNLNAQQFSYFYSVGSWPAIVLCFFGGFLIDRVFGIKVGTVIYTSIAIIGHLIFSFGILFNSFWCGLLGRFFYGIGNEMILICLLYYSVVYFKGKELSMVQCLLMSLSRLGSAAVFEMAYPMLKSVRLIYQGNKDVGIVCFMLGSFIVTSLLSSVVLMFMSPKNKTEVSEKKPKQIKLSDVLHFGWQYWLTVISSCAFCMNVYIILPFSQGFFTTQHGLSLDEANVVSSFLSLMGAASAFLTGVMIDKIGYEISFALFGFCLAIVSHLILAFTLITPFLSMFLLAISFSILAASLFPLYAYIVPESMLGTAYGTKQALVNLSFSLLIILAGAIVDNYGYQELEIFIAANVLVGLISSAILWVYNYKVKGNLNWSAAQRRNENKDRVNEVSQPLRKN